MILVLLGIVVIALFILGPVLADDDDDTFGAN